VAGVLALAWAGGLLPSRVDDAGAGWADRDLRLRTSSAPAPGEEPSSGQRLLPAPQVPATGGSFTFLHTLGDGLSPVSWDPCRPVRYVVRADGEVPGGAAALAGALTELSAATGLRFVDGGRSEEGPSDEREAYQPQRYGSGWAPVLVTWSDPAESPRLGGDVTGYAGPVAYGRAGQRERYVSGQVVLDAPQLRQLQAGPGGAAAVRAVLLHEFAHLAGLGHVDDASQVMNPVGSAAGPFSFADGDRRGLALLGAGGCR